VTVSGGLELQEVVRARDGTRKLIFKLTGGEAAGGWVGRQARAMMMLGGRASRVNV
jgi:hypothetical protein